MPTSTPTSTASSDSTGVPAPSTSVTAVPEPLRPVAMDMPAGTHPATKADMSKFLSHNWASTANKYAVIYMGKSQPFDGTEEIKKEFNGNVPEGLRMLTYDPTCNAVQTAVWFDGNTMRTTAWGMQTLRGCQIDVEKQSEEFQTFMKQSDIYFNAAGDRAYLKRTDGKVSEWIIATN
ncbi:hypothetical protein [Corynebacterium matruchotii]|uniref:hypothetical protein n=1 Tax=Corynebacterium matruchotii TaxID=43768 RepID=UPI0028ED5DF1|nr:hypothetical protein [Corynebacterium matruchotii]